MDVVRSSLYGQLLLDAGLVVVQFRRPRCRQTKVAPASALASRAPRPARQCAGGRHAHHRSQNSEDRAVRLSASPACPTLDFRLAGPTTARVDGRRRQRGSDGGQPVLVRVDARFRIIEGGGLVDVAGRHPTTDGLADLLLLSRPARRLAALCSSWARKVTHRRRPQDRARRGGSSSSAPRSVTEDVQGGPAPDSALQAVADHPRTRRVGRDPFAHSRGTR